jgi:glycosyltransferase involved in cell wall biosynthesis
LKIAWWSNAPDILTGYGVQTQQIASRMAAAGHEVHILGNYGHRAGVKQVGNLYVWPEGVSNYGLDVAPAQADMIEPDVVFTLYDVWVMKEEWKGRRVLSWTPIDHLPPPPDVLKWSRDHDTIAMSEFGAKELRGQGIEPIATIWHGVEPVYHRVETDIRARTGIPDDAFVVMVNAANIGTTPPRKAWSENLHALAMFMHRHSDVYAYLHTDIARPGGSPLPVLIEALQVPHERLRIASQVRYRGGFIEAPEMAALYSSSDVLLATSKGEGFGVPVIEAMACGTPSIVSDFSAQPELVGDTGWLVEGQFDWDWNQGAEFFTPFTAHQCPECGYRSGILAALEDAYAHRGERREACVERAKLFDADMLFQKHWVPLLANIEADLAKPKRKGMSKGSQKRAKKAA